MTIQSASATRLSRDAAAALRFQLRSRGSASKDGKKFSCMSARHLPSSNDGTISQQPIHVACTTSQTVEPAPSTCKSLNLNSIRHGIQRRPASTLPNNGTPKPSSKIPTQSTTATNTTIDLPTTPSPQSQPPPPPPPVDISSADVDVPILLFRKSGLKHASPRWDDTYVELRDPTVWYDLWERYGLSGLPRWYQDYVKVVQMFPPSIQERIEKAAAPHSDTLKRCLEYGIVDGLLRSLRLHWRSMVRTARASSGAVSSDRGTASSRPGAVSSDRGTASSRPGHWPSVILAESPNPGHSAMRKRWRRLLRIVWPRLPTWVTKYLLWWLLLIVFIAFPSFISPTAVEARTKRNRVSRERGQLPVDVNAEGQDGVAMMGEAAAAVAAAKAG